MRVLLDTCVWRGALRDLRDAGIDMEWCGDWPKDPGDKQILARAFEEHRIIVTLDKDFGELVMVYGLPHAGIVRLVDIAAREQGLVSVDVLNKYGPLLEAGAIVTVLPDRIRVRTGP